MAHRKTGSGHVDLIGNPLKLSETPANPTKAPPRLGEDPMRVLASHVGLQPDALVALQQDGVIG